MATPKPSDVREFELVVVWPEFKEKAAQLTAEGKPFPDEWIAGRYVAEGRLIGNVPEVA